METTSLGQFFSCNQYNHFLLHKIKTKVDILVIPFFFNGNSLTTLE